MRSRALILLSVLIAGSVPALANAAVISGRVLNARNSEPVAFANVLVREARLGGMTSVDGEFEISGLEPGLYNVHVSQIGYQATMVAEVFVTNVKPATIEVFLEEQALLADSVTVAASPFIRRDESPVSLRTLSSAEIERLPGGNRDISKVIQSLPGVASTPTFRNDIIVRGGAPNENRFYLDGVEVPTINHFATQGSSGGPVGMLNVDFLREVELFTGAFPASRGNALSSVMDVRMLDGNENRLVGTATVGATDFGLTLDGPVGGLGTFIFSARRSYLQFLFEAFDLPFLPIYNDFQLKSRLKLDPKNELTLVGLAAIDNFELNTGASNTDLNQYLLNLLAPGGQWNYGAGVTWRRLQPNGVLTTVLSRNHLHNDARKYVANDDSDPNNLLLDYDSQEIENKVRVEQTLRAAGLKWNYGAGFETAEYRVSTIQNRAVPAGPFVVAYASQLDFSKYALFAQASRPFIDRRLTLSLGLRTDFADYSAATNDPLEQLSPRLSASFALNPRWSINFNTGRFFQLPPYTTLGFRDSTGRLVNKDNGIRYISSNHFVGGVQYAGSANSRVTVEGFFKKYDDYPFLLQERVSLANLGADFGVIGDAPADPASAGRSHGVEWLLQQRLYRGYYGIASYTFVRSEFTTGTGAYAPSAWDNRHVVSFTGGKRWNNGWEFGMRWRYLGGAPYTPDDVELSSRRDVWDTQQEAVPNWALLNTERTSSLHQLDVRIDKKWFYRNTSLNVFVDVQNLYNYVVRLKPILTVELDAQGNPIVDPSDNTRYLMRTIEDESGTILPSFGVTFEF